jgi:hypothetical protein
MMKIVGVLILFVLLVGNLVASQCPKNCLCYTITGRISSDSVGLSIPIADTMDKISSVFVNNLLLIRSRYNITIVNGMKMIIIPRLPVSKTITEDFKVVLN